jgi:TRAP-type mannitol/chloroaromatic compound transport system substrate-binding protein
MRLVSIFVLALLSLAALPAFGQQSPAEPRMRLRMQTAFNPGLSVLGEGARHFVDSVKASSNGALSFKMVEAGGRVPSAELLDAPATSTPLSPGAATRWPRCRRSTSSPRCRSARASTSISAG